MKGTGDASETLMGIVGAVLLLIVVVGVVIVVFSSKATAAKFGPHVLFGGAVIIGGLLIYAIRQVRFRRNVKNWRQFHREGKTIDSPTADFGAENWPHY